MSGAGRIFASWLRRFGVSAGTGAQLNDPRRDQELLDAVWEALNIGRDNKALVVARDGTIIKANQLASQLCGRPWSCSTTSPQGIPPEPPSAGKPS